jgi:predicted NAD-dependent protein-ADP-ribosyltransferase YbiA (DUF1768 family)
MSQYDMGGFDFGTFDAGGTPDKASDLEQKAQQKKNLLDMKSNYKTVILNPETIANMDADSFGGIRYATESGAYYDAPETQHSQSFYDPNDPRNPNRLAQLERQSQFIADQTPGVTNEDLKQQSIDATELSLFDRLVNNFRETPVEPRQPTASPDVQQYQHVFDAGDRAKAEFIKKAYADSAARGDLTEEGYARIYVDDSQQQDATGKRNVGRAYTADGVNIADALNNPDQNTQFYHPSNRRQIIAHLDNQMREEAAVDAKYDTAKERSSFINLLDQSIGKDATQVVIKATGSVTNALGRMSEAMTDFAFDQANRSVGSQLTAEQEASLEKLSGRQKEKARNRMRAENRDLRIMELTKAEADGTLTDKQKQYIADNKEMFEQNKWEYQVIEGHAQDFQNAMSEITTILDEQGTDWEDMQAMQKFQNNHSLYDLATENPQVLFNMMGESAALMTGALVASTYFYRDVKDALQAGQEEPLSSDQKVLAAALSVPLGMVNKLAIDKALNVGKVTEKVFEKVMKAKPDSAILKSTQAAVQQAIDKGKANLLIQTAVATGKTALIAPKHLAKAGTAEGIEEVIQGMGVELIENRGDVAKLLSDAGFFDRRIEEFLLGAGAADATSITAAGAGGTKATARNLAKGSKTVANEVYQNTVKFDENLKNESSQTVVDNVKKLRSLDKQIREQNRQIKRQVEDGETVNLNASQGVQAKLTEQRTQAAVDILGEIAAIPEAERSKRVQNVFKQTAKLLNNSIENQNDAASAKADSEARKLLDSKDKNEQLKGVDMLFRSEDSAGSVDDTQLAFNFSEETIDKAIEVATGEKKVALENIKEMAQVHNEQFKLSDSAIVDGNAVPKVGTQYTIADRKVMIAAAKKAGNKKALAAHKKQLENFIKYQRSKWTALNEAVKAGPQSKIYHAVNFNGDYEVIDTNTEAGRTRYSELKGMKDVGKNVFLWNSSNATSVQRAKILKDQMLPREVQGYKQALASINGVQPQQQQPKPKTNPKEQQQQQQQAGTQTETNIWHGSNENAELSNLAERPFEIKGKKFRSVEHAYQTLKSGSFDEETYNKYNKPGQKIPGKPANKKTNVALMARLIKASFDQNPAAVEALLATGDTKLTHNQDKGIWNKVFPEILTRLRKQYQTKKSTTTQNSTPAPEPTQISTTGVQQDLFGSDVPVEKKNLNDLTDSSIVENTLNLIQSTRANRGQGDLKKRLVKSLKALAANPGKYSIEQKRNLARMVRDYQNGSNNLSKRMEDILTSFEEITEQEQVVDIDTGNQLSLDLDSQEAIDYANARIHGRMNSVISSIADKIIALQDKKITFSAKVLKAFGIDKIAGIWDIFDFATEPAFPDFTIENLNTIANVAKYIRDTGLIKVLQDRLLPDVNQLSGGYKQPLEKSINGLEDPTTIIMSALRNDPKALELMLVSAMDWMIQEGKDTEYLDDDNVRSFLGYSEFDDVNPEILKKYRKLGTKRENAAQHIGRNIVKMLGIKANPTTAAQNPAAIKKLEAQFGMLMLDVLKNAKLIEINYTPINEFMADSARDQKIENEGADVVTVRVAQLKMKGETTQRAREAMEVVPAADMGRLAEALYGQDYTRGFQTKPIEKVKFSIKNSLFKVTEKMGEFLKRQQQVKWVVNDLGRVMDRFTDDQLKMIMGYTEDPENHQAMLRDGIEGSNIGIERQIGNLRAAMLDSAKGFFFPYHVVSNSRFFINTNTFNPQGSKLHRHSVIIEDNIEDVQVDDNGDIPTVIKVGYALALGAKDVSSESQALQHLDTMLNDPVIQEALTVLQNNTVGGFSNEEVSILQAAVDKGGEDFYTMDALTSIAKWKATKPGESYTNTFAVETDGITNGALLGLLQVPLGNNIYDWLARGGIFTKGSGYKENADVRAKKGDKGNDMYQTLAKKFNQALARVAKENPELKDEIKELKAIMGDVVVNDKVTSVGRNYFKNPLMVFFYGAGNKSIKRKLASDVIENMWKTLDKDSTNDKDLQAQQEAILDFINNSFGEGFKSVSLDNRKDLELTPAQVETLIENLIDKGLGTVTDVMQDEFKEIINFKKVQIDLLNVQGEIFEYMYKLSMDRVRRKYKLPEDTLFSDEMLNEAIDQVMKYVPRTHSHVNQDLAVMAIKEKLVHEYKTSIENKIPIGLRKYAVSHTKGNGKVSSQQKQRFHNSEYDQDAVAALVKSVHTLDSGMIQETLNEYYGLILHDATLHKASESPAVSKQHNKTVFEHSRDHFITDDIRQVTNQMIRDFTAFQERRGVDPQAELDNLNREINRKQVARTNYSNTSNIEYLRESVKRKTAQDPDDGPVIFESMEQRTQMLNAAVDIVKAHRDKVMASITGTQQIAHPMKDSIYTPEGKIIQRPKKLSALLYPQINAVQRLALYSQQFADELSYREKRAAEDLLRDFAAEATPEEAANLTKAETTQEPLFSEDQDPLGEFDETAQTYSINSETVMNQFTDMLDASPQIGGQYVTDLQNIVRDIFQKVLTPAEGITLTVQDAIDGVTRGALYRNEVRIKRTQNRPTSMAMSAAEVYVHELMHLVTAAAIEGGKNFGIETQIQEIMDSVQQYMIDEAKARGYSGPHEFMMPRDNDGQPLLKADLDTELAKAQERYDYIFNNKKGVGIHEFVAHLSNEQFAEVLKNTRISKNKTNNLNKMQQIWAGIMNFMNTWIRKMAGKRDRSDNAYLEMIGLIQDLHDLNQTTGVVKHLRAAGIQMKAVTGWGSYQISRVANPVLRKFNVNTDKISSLRNVVRSIEATAAYQAFSKRIDQTPALRNILDKLYAKDGLMYSIISQTILDSGTELFDEFKSQLRITKSQIDKLRKEQNESTVKYIMDRLPADLSKEDREILTQVLIEYDVGKLGVSVGSIIEYFEDGAKLNTKLSSLENQILNNQKFMDVSNSILDQLEGLGAYKATGNIYNAAAQVDSARALVKLLKGEGYSINATEVKQFNQLIAMYALKHTNADQKAHFVNVQDHILEGENPRISQDIISMYQDITGHLESTENKLAHGYTKEIYDPTINQKIAEVSKAAEMKKKGYKLAYTFPDKPEVGLYVSHTDKMTDYQTGIYSQTQYRPSRFNLVDVYKNNIGFNLDTGFYVKNTYKKAQAATVQAHKNLQVTLLRNQRNFATTNATGSFLTNMGEMYIALPKDVKRNVLGQTNEIADVMGELAAYNVDLTQTKQHNAYLISNLFEQYNAEWEENDGKFDKRDWVDIRSEHPELYFRLKHSLDSTPGLTDQFVKHPKVPRDVLRIAFGYQKASIKQWQYGKEKMPPQLFHAIGLAETLLEEIAQLGAVQIVIKTPEVLLNNIVSNINVLMLYGIPLGRVVKESLDAHKYLKQYQADNEVVLATKLVINNTVDKREKAKLEATVKNTERRMARNPVKPLLDQGLFSLITEDINLTDTAKQILDKMPLVDKYHAADSDNYVKKVIAHVFWTKESAPFQFLQRMTQESDFWARYVLFNHLTRTTNRNQDDIAAEAMRTFIQYDIPAHPALQYMNDHGLLRFTKWLFGVQPVMYERSVANPIGTLATIGLHEAVTGQESMFDSALIGTDKLYNKLSYGFDLGDIIKQALEPKGLQALSLGTMGHL